MNRVILLVGNQMDVIGHLSPEMIANPTTTALPKEHLQRTENSC